MKCLIMLENVLRLFGMSKHASQFRSMSEIGEKVLQCLIIFGNCGQCFKILDDV